VIKILKLYNFRNYEQERIEFDPGMNVVIGKNGRGKTNLLEALYFLLQGISMRTSEVKEMVRNSEGEALVEGLLDIGREVTARIAIENDRIIRKGMIKENLGAVCFQPDDIWMVKGGPEVRRRYLDELISQVKKAYREDIREYQRVLRQRNEAIKAARKGTGKREYIRNWNPLLVRSAGAIVDQRIKTIKNLEQEMGKIGGRWGIGEIAIRYYSTLGGEGWDEEKIAEKLHKIEETEIRRGATLLGPHRDEMIFSMNGKNVRRECSQGEQKLTAITWRLAQGRLYMGEAGRSILLLMDDCLSELDSDNRAKVMEETRDWGQTIITSTDDMVEFNDLKKIVLN
jgi:DNA replication and repair protein RecF